MSDDIHVCPVCEKYTITVQTRTQYFRDRNFVLKDRSCLPCWRHLLDVDAAMRAMDGPGA